MPQTVKISVPGPLQSVSVIGDSDADAGAGPSDRAGAEQDAARQARASIDGELAAIRQARQAMDRSVAELEQIHAQILREAEGQLIDLAIGIAKKVIMQEIHTSRHEIEPIVTEALRHVPPRQRITVHLHPDDLKCCKMIEKSDESPSDERLRFVGDPTVRRAECLLVTSEGIVHSEIDSHFEEIRETLKAPNKQ